MSVLSLMATLAVNPAFLEEIKDSNTTLWSRLDQLRAVCNASLARGIALQRIVPLVNEVRDLLALQFALEETYGFVEIHGGSDPGADAALLTPTRRKDFMPSLEIHQRADQCRSQHCALYLAINDLAEQAEELQYRGWVPEKVDALIRDIRHFDLQLADHERCERALLHDVRRGSSKRKDT